MLKIAATCILDKLVFHIDGWHNTITIGYDETTGVTTTLAYNLTGLDFIINPFMFMSETIGYDVIPVDYLNDNFGGFDIRYSYGTQKLFEKFGHIVPEHLVIPNVFDLSRWLDESPEPKIQDLDDMVFNFWLNKDV